MSNRLFRFILGVGLLVIAVLPASAQSDQIFGLVDVDLAEVRSGPDFAYPTIDRLPRNSSVVILGRAGDFVTRWDGRQWLQITYGGGKAWVYARLLRTSMAFNSIPPTGRILPRDRNGRVPDGFDLSYDICDQWGGSFSRVGDFMAGDRELTVTYPTLIGANVYSVIVISPTGVRRAFDSTSGTSKIILDHLPQEEGTYTWRVAPYWTYSNYRFEWQQVCLLQTGGVFDKPYTGFTRPHLSAGG
ncbi:MAG: SH3 domain-containing protein [Anaerolineae bacterium]|nr:SH3 domain-containing protein [Anaerolineae bacterium]